MTPRTDWTPAMLGLAAVLLCSALAISAGLRDELALALVTGAMALSLVAGRILARGQPRTGHVAAIAILSLGIGEGVIRQLFQASRIPAAASRTAEYRLGIAVCAAVAATYLWRGAPSLVRRTRFAVLTALAALIGALVISAVPAPRIDVWHLQRLGAAELMAGRNPYSATYPNIYGPRTSFLDRSLLSADGWRVTAFPYTPLTVLADIPGALAGDVRWTLLVATLAAAWLIRLLGRGSTVAELAGGLVLLQAQGFWVIERSWTEPVALLTTLAAALAISRARGWLVPGLALGLAASSKQYLVLLLVPLWLAMPERHRWRALGVAVALALALIAPFLVWDAAGLVRGLVEFQVRQPFRPDALSWPAIIVQLGGPRLPSWPAFAIAAGVLALLSRPGARVGQALVASAAAWIAFVVFNKQAFANYYWLAVGLLCAAVASVAPSPPAGDQREPTIEPLDALATHTRAV